MSITNPLESNYKQYLPHDAYSDADASSVAGQARNILSEVYSDHVASMKRNTADTAIDNQAISGDIDSIKLATSTSALSAQLQSYIARGGNFSDEQGRQLGEQFMVALRRQGDDSADDSITDLQYAGRNGMDENKRQDALLKSVSIADAVSVLTDPDISSERSQQQLLQGILANATAISADTADSAHTGGKDQNDAAKESAVIANDARALLTAGDKLTPQQQALLVSDMGSKAELIWQELQDIPIELKYASHDTAAIRADAGIQAVLSDAIQHHSSRSIGQLKEDLAQFHTPDAKGLLDTIVRDRRQDMQLEPFYIKANTADNAQNNHGIIEFTNPFISRAS